MAGGEPPRRDPATRTLVIVAASQLVALLTYDLGHDPAGRALQASLLNALMLQVPLYLAALVAPVALWAAAARLLGRWRIVVDTPAIVLAAFLAFIAHLDLWLQRFRGERLSLNHFAAYGSGNILNSDWIRPVLEVPWTLALALAVILVTWGLLGVEWWRALRARAASTSWRRIAGYVVGAAACQGVTGFAYYHQRDMARPPQSLLLGALLHPPRPWDAARERADRDDMRRMLDPAGAARWRSDEFPLWRDGTRDASPSFGAARRDPPDIVLLAVESLRGRDVGWGFGPPRASGPVTPHLDSLARDAVTFPHWIAGGEPSPRGFITLQTGAWEHGHLFITANLPDLHIDALPEHLRRAGYATFALWGGNPSFDNQLTWGRRWYDSVDFQARENRLFYLRVRPDREVMDRAIDEIGAHDREHAGQPFFMYLATAGTHTPYDVDDDSTPPAPAGAGRQERYDRTLANLDAQAGRLVAALRARARWRNTVVIVVGDHSDLTDEPSDPRLHGMPTDALVGTAALVYGPRRLVGAPRVDSTVASHVDVMPTVLAWLGDTSAVTTFGRDLFDPARPADREAVAINSRGYRIDRGGFTLIVDHDDPRIWYAWRSFTGEQPQMLPLSVTPFAADAPSRLVERVSYWSYLVERNRVRPPQDAGEAKSARARARSSGKSTSTHGSPSVGTAATSPDSTHRAASSSS